MRTIEPPGPPHGLRRLLLKAPLAVYRIGLGALFGHRLIRLEHVGRRSGRVHNVVLEVVDHDPVAGTLTVASGFGARADWYRNLLAHPRTRITVGNHRRTATARRLSSDEGARCMVAYARRHRRMGRRLARFMGYEVDGSDQDFAALGRRLPFIRLEPSGDPVADHRS
ncbi:nitroreductase family deazaflavin-dependent oxidoreductase [Actinoplanes sp. NPDC048967]|uniref:nitroreductase family deazaflavin-dependent oxidoreductase n=1 Tax=Actinoplanes sp. NPDC048967 TaxID=3155269 RepID=UPI0033E9BBE2